MATITSNTGATTSAVAMRATTTDITRTGMAIATTNTTSTMATMVMPIAKPQVKPATLKGRG